MRKNLFCTLFLLTVALTSNPASLSAQSADTAPPAQSATVSMQPYKGNRVVVAVRLNGAGPYDFLVDTGATVTVLDAALFQELGITANDSAAVASSVGGAGSVQLASTVKEVSLNGLSAQNIRVVSMKDIPLGANYRGVRGILGENFLHKFDILIDNQHHKMTLDAGAGLANSLDGERLPITFVPPVNGGEMRFRPMVSISVAGIGSRAVRVLLDSGADAFSMVEPISPHRASGIDMTVRTVAGSMACIASADRLHWGKGTVADLNLITCQSPTANPQDHEGNLPTALFQQLFICHAGGYAIVKPSKRAHPPVEMAAVETPAAR